MIMRTQPLISEKYRSMQQQLHQNPNYGVASLGFAPLVAKIAKGLGLKSISDYGAGKCNLNKGLINSGLNTFEYYPYDPAFPAYGDPVPADLVCCIDVLEHIEPDHLDNVLANLAEITIKVGFFSIHTGPAMKVLSDGRNAHLIQKPSSWWLDRLIRYFNIEQLQNLPEGSGFWIIVTPVMQNS
ncbi:MAG: class I SAM-dependent methyltransferase [Betaproteobacteria bacterium]|nr:class I SAM-dependent methyltransferase [Betaproteobacteria bacterium]